MSHYPQHPSPRNTLRIKRALVYLYTRHVLSARLTERLYHALSNDLVSWESMLDLWVPEHMMVKV